MRVWGRVRWCEGCVLEYGRRVRSSAVAHGRVCLSVVVGVQLSAVGCDRVWLGVPQCAPPEIKIYSKKSGVDPTQDSDY